MLHDEKMDKTHLKNDISSYKAERMKMFLTGSKRMRNANGFKLCI